MSKKKENIIVLTGDDGEDIEVEVIDQTVVNGTNYLLVADVVDDDEDGDCYILKDVSNGNSENADYEIVPNDEADGIFDTFENMLKDEIDFKK